jgi:excinuclease ABC subunit B
VQPTYAQSTSARTTVPGTRARKPTLDEMGSAANRPIPARAPQVDPRTKAGAYGEHVRGPHKPTLDEMGPHAERGLPVAGKPLPAKPPVKTIEIPDEGERKKHRRGRLKKTGRPGQ